MYGVTEFYEMFHTHPVGQKVIRVCQDGPCAVAGADASHEVPRPECQGDIPVSKATVCGFGVIFAIAPSPAPAAIMPVDNA